MTAEEGARALYDAGRAFQLEELAKTLDMQPWLQLLAAHKRCAAAGRAMAECRMKRISGMQHPAEQEQNTAIIQLYCCLVEVNIMAIEPGYTGFLQIELYKAARYHTALADACPEYLA